MGPFRVGIAYAVVAGCCALGLPNASASPSAWKVATPAPVATAHRLNAIACVTPSSCVAVGQQQTATVFQPLVERWSGSSWSVQSFPAVTGDATLLGVSCVESVVCMAVGVAYNPTRPISAKWDGSAWTLVAVPDPMAQLGSALHGVSCVSRTFCIAVGDIQDASSHSMLVYRWDGVQWTRVAVSGGNAALNGVSCVSVSTCVAVGRGFGTGQVIIRWDGVAWSMMAAPSVALSLAAVACSNSVSCIAVGTSPSNTTITEVYDGSTWSSVSSPNVGTNSNSFASVSCGSATSCVIGGEYFNDTTSRSETLLATWDGTHVALASHPLAVSTAATITGVVCAGEGSCVAVGTGNLAQPGTVGIALTGTSPLASRAVAVSWDPTENARLLQLSAYLGQSPAAVQKSSVFLMGYLIGFLPPTPTPQTLPSPGVAATYTTIWEPSEVAVLDSVKVKFVLSDSDATRLSIGLLSFLLGLGGH